LNPFKAIFGTAESAKTVVDGAVAGLDAIVFTEEEKSAASAKLGDWFLKYLAATQPQNLARRVIAVAIVALWIGLILLGVILRAFDEEFSAFVFRVLTEIVNAPFLTVMGFYFAAHIVRAWQGSKAE
jgi:hypothetical protein